MRKRISEEYHRGYRTDYFDGYKNGADDAQNGVLKTIVSVNILDLPIGKMGFSVRAYNCLCRARLDTVRDVVNYDEADILKVRNLGLKTAADIAVTLHKHGIIHTAWDKFLPIEYLPEVP